MWPFGYSLEDQSKVTLDLREGFNAIARSHSSAVMNASNGDHVYVIFPVSDLDYVTHNTFFPIE